jgi:diadenylate cyclase
VVEVIVSTVAKLSKNKVGALIALERNTGLRTYIEGGIRLDALVQSEMLETIFYPGTPLHDGAVIVQAGRIAAAGCLFPLTDNPHVAKNLGTRHRSGLGLSEETDAVVIIVSEETGTISLAVNGKLRRPLDREGLLALLHEVTSRSDPAFDDEGGDTKGPGVEGSLA